MREVTCCCCGKTADFEDVWELWYPSVFHGNESLGDLCDKCEEKVGLRDSIQGEFPHNQRIENYDAFVTIKKNG